MTYKRGKGGVKGERWVPLEGLKGNGGSPGENKFNSNEEKRKKK